LTCAHKDEPRFARPANPGGQQLHVTR
jgi:hypothetical protein